MRRWPAAARCRTPSAAPTSLVASTESTGRLPAARSTHTIAVPRRSSPARWDWSSPAGASTSPSTCRAANCLHSACSRAASSSRLAESTKTPRGTATSSTARWTAAENGLATSSRSNPIVAVL